MNVDIWQNIFDGCIWNRRDGEIDKSRLYTKYILSTVVEKDVNYSTHTHTYIMTLRMQVVNYIFAEGENLWLIYNENNESSMYRVHQYI